MSRGPTASCAAPSPLRGGRSWRRIGALGRLAAASLLLAGCATQPKDDPLVGGPPIPSNPAKPAPSATAATTTAPTDPRTGTPASTARPTASQAALASGVPTGDPLLGTPDDPRLHSTAPDWHGPSGPGATLHDPQPVETTGASSTSPGPGVMRAVAPAPRVDSYQQAQDLLASLGVTEQVLETVGDKGDWHFLCKIPDPHKPGSKLVFEGTAPGENGLAVIRAVLHKMEQSPELNP